MPHHNRRTLQQGEPIPAKPNRSTRKLRRAKQHIRRTQHICWICGNEVNNTLTFPDPQSGSVDHVEPVDLHPELINDITNLKLAHLRCNIQRGRGDRNNHTPQSQPW